MTTSAAQAAAFYDEATREGAVWTLRDDGGYPAPLTANGDRAQPFWSLRSRAELVVARVPAYSGFTIVEVTLDDFRARWLPGLQADGLCVGLNWSGAAATGYDVPAAEVAARLDD